MKRITACACVSTIDFRQVLFWCLLKVTYKHGLRPVGSVNDLARAISFARVTLDRTVVMGWKVH